MKVALSILTVDFSDFNNKTKDYFNEADYIHMDIMDGNFVPNISIGPAVVKSLRKLTDKPFDTHLMIHNPYDYIRFDNDENDENAFYYFFVLDRDKNKNLLLEMKIEEHKNKCGRCNLCKKYTEAKVREKFENIDLYYIIYNKKNFVLNLMNKI